MSITIKMIEPGLFTIGIIDKAGWTSLRDCSTREEAMAWLSYLNGGVHPNEIEGYWNKSSWADRDTKAK